MSLPLAGLGATHILNPPMPDLFASLPADAIARLSEPEGYKSWKICTLCHASHVEIPLRACLGCLKAHGDRIYYCVSDENTFIMAKLMRHKSKICQKGHWKTHKMVCGRQTSRRNDTTTKVQKAISRWSDVHSTILVRSLHRREIWLICHSVMVA